MRKEIILKGLTCVGCANKIEKEIKNISKVKSVNMDFVASKLIIQADEEDLAGIIRESKRIIKNIEPNVKISEKIEDDKEFCRKKIKFTRIIIGTILFLITIIFKFDTLIEFILYLLSYILIGGEVLFRALKNSLKGKVFDENFLMSIATIGAFSIGELSEGVAVMLFYQVGEFFQDIAVNHSRKSITDLMDIRPDYANLKIEKELKKVSPEQVKIGNIIIVKPGEKIPLDGDIIEGKSFVDTSALTGESVLREVSSGSGVLGGFVNKSGVLTIKVTKEFGESTVSKILDLVQNAKSKKAPTENFITKFAGYYTPTVVIIALILAVVPTFVIQDALFSDWVYRALIFLVISCPCALVISIPLGFFGGIGGASKVGVLIKGSNYLEALNNVDTVVFDKTGTLTKGVFKVTEINTNDNLSKNELLKYAAYAECYSNHPIAASILDAYGKEINKESIENYQEISGHGILANVFGREILAGNEQLMNNENIDYDKSKIIGTIVHIAIDKKYCGNIVIADEVKEDSERAVKELKKIGIKKTVMLTGDNITVGESIANEIGIDEVYSELLPDQKVVKLEMLSKQKTTKGSLVFVGDGINDAPSLARADIGIAMGGLGSDAAIESADIVLMTDQPSKIVQAIIIAKKTRSIVWQNIIFALLVKVIVLLLGAGGIATMWEAVFADVGVTLIAVLNAMRVLKY